MTRSNYFLLWVLALLTVSQVRDICPQVRAESMQGREQSDVHFPLEVNIKMDKAVYKVGDEITLCVSLRNRGEQPIHLYRVLDWGSSASLSLRVKDQSNKEIPRRFLDDALTPPPSSDVSDLFVPLLPDHFFGTTRESSLEELNINKPGKYKISVEYHSPVPKTLSSKLSIWGKENGVIESKPIQIEVVRE